MNWLKQNHVKYALIMTGIIVLCLAYMHLTGQYDEFPGGKSPVEAVLLMIAPFIVWFLGIREKKKLQKGKLTFKQGVQEGFKMSLVFGLISPFVFLAYYTLFNPGILEYVAKEYKMSEAPRETVIAFDMLVQFIGSIIGGTIYAAIVSFFLKTK